MDSSSFSRYFFIVGKLDCDMSDDNEKQILENRAKSFQFANVDAELEDIYSYSNSMLAIHSKIMSEHMEEHRRLATVRWLQSRSEEERQQYLGRVQLGIPLA